MYEQRSRDAAAPDEFDGTPWVKIAELDPISGAPLPTREPEDDLDPWRERVGVGADRGVLDADAAGKVTRCVLP